MSAARHSDLSLLLVEDNPADIRLTQEALQEAGFPCRLTVATDGVKALQILREDNSVKPDLILLDWNLPRMDGSEVLREIKLDERLREIPVIVLTTSRAPRDVLGAYDLHANCFITKPASITQFFEVITAVELFWGRTASLPPK